MAKGEVVESNVVARILTVLGYILLLPLFPLAVKIVQEYERGVIFRLGRLQGAKGPGLFIILPIVDRMVKMDLRVFTLDVPSQEIITRDNVTVKVDAVIYFRVVNPEDAVVKVENYFRATALIAQTTLRSTIGQSELDTLLSHRDEINQRLQIAIDEATEPWGIKVSMVEVRDVLLAPEMVRSMARQAEAERERRAKVIHAEGELQASEKLAEAGRIIAASPGTLQLRYLQTLTEIASERNSTILFPLPIDLIQSFLTRVGASAAAAQPATSRAARAAASPKATAGCRPIGGRPAVVYSRSVTSPAAMVTRLPSGRRRMRLPSLSTSSASPSSAVSPAGDPHLTAQRLQTRPPLVLHPLTGLHRQVQLFELVQDGGRQRLPRDLAARLGGDAGGDGGDLGVGGHVGVDVDADAQQHVVHGLGRQIRFHKNAADLAPAYQHVVGPLEGRPQACHLLEAARHRQRSDDGQRPQVLQRRPEDDGEVEAPSRRHERSPQPAASRRLAAGQHHRALGGAGPGQLAGEVLRGAQHGPVLQPAADEAGRQPVPQGLRGEASGHGSKRIAKKPALRLAFCARPSGLARHHLQRVAVRLDSPKAVASIIVHPHHLLSYIRW